MLTDEYKNLVSSVFKMLHLNAYFYGSTLNQIYTEYHKKKKKTHRNCYHYESNCSEVAESLVWIGAAISELCLEELSGISGDVLKTKPRIIRCKTVGLFFENSHHTCVCVLCESLSAFHFGFLTDF